ncbi:MATE family efflux transporter [Anaeromassilibacillus sp. SJQ-1]|uniref:MATE family efflux transporter n=1 Tax=Anaeromassilibacillus sp. SJQ-1 TaxID=3375419 RepID=UPI003988A7BA
MVDSIVVGNFIGEKALAAVGTGFPIIFMMSSLFMGLSTGATIMISQYYGARDMENVRATVNTIYTAMMIGIIPLTIIGILCSRPLLLLMNVPNDGTLELAEIYMIVIFVGMIGTLGFNINAGILQGLGDSRTSLLFLSTAAGINIVLDLAFTFCGMVFWVALAPFLHRSLPGCSACTLSTGITHSYIFISSNFTSIVPCFKRLLS